MAACHVRDNIDVKLRRATIPILLSLPGWTDVSEEDFQRIMSEAHPDITDYKPTVMGSPDTQVSFNNSYDSPSYEVSPCPATGVASLGQAH